MRSSVPRTYYGFTCGCRMLMPFADDKDQALDWEECPRHANAYSLQSSMNTLMKAVSRVLGGEGQKNWEAPLKEAFEEARGAMSRSGTL